MVTVDVVMARLPSGVKGFDSVTGGVERNHRPAAPALLQPLGSEAARDE
jgi:hypothetical protein